VSRLNTELFKKIHEVVSANPQRHDQATWEGQSVGDCGTTRCVAGWAVHLATGQKVFRWESGVPNVLLSGATVRLAREHGIPAESGDDPGVVPKVASKMLGLTDVEAEYLFYADDDRAREIVAAAAAGDIEAFQRVLYRAGE
jgi:hypothetical protein